MKLEGTESVHEFLRQYIEVQQEFLDEFNKKRMEYIFINIQSENGQMRRGPGSISQWKILSMLF